MLQGTLPLSLRQLTHLKTLDLSLNSLHGDLVAIRILSELERLYLGYNNFTENGLQLMDLRLTQLKEFNITNNPNLSGSLFDTDIAYFKDTIEIFDISNCSFYATISKILFSQYENLQIFRADNNNFSGAIVNRVNARGYQSLVEFSVSGNRLSGNIPWNVLNRNLLTTLNFSGNLHTGTIPESIGEFTALQHLDLSNNQLKSTIPTQIGRLTQLVDLKLNSNAFSGTLPLLELEEMSALRK